MEIVAQTLKLFLDVNQIMIFMGMDILYAEDMDNGICLLPYVKVNLDTDLTYLLFYRDLVGSVNIWCRYAYTNF